MDETDNLPVTGMAEVNYRNSPKELTEFDWNYMCLPRALRDVDPRQVVKELWNPLIKYMGPPLKPGISRRVEAGQGLLLYGSQGIGKTSIAAIIAIRARSWRHSVYWTTYSAIRKCRRDGGFFDPDDETTPLERAQTVDLLVLDNLTEIDLTDKYYGEGELLHLLKVRSDIRRPTVITTRMLSRVRFMTTLVESIPGLIPFPVKGPNRVAAANSEFHKQLFG